MKPQDNKNNLIVVYLLLSSIILLLTNSLGFSQRLRSYIESVFQPITYYGLYISSEINRNTDYFSKLTQNKNNIDSLNKKIEQLELKNDEFNLLQKKYDSLLQHSNVSNKKYNYIEATAYVPSNGTNIILDVGKRESIVIGDVVVIGNSYIGNISKVDENSSLVKSPNQPNSLIEVSIQLKSNKNIKGIAKGVNHEIIIENILSNVGVEVGDLVYISDQGIKGNLILGKISEIKKDPAASIITAKVSMGIDLSLNNFVYVRK